jgi:hypothetical protein
MLRVKNLHLPFKTFLSLLLFRLKNSPQMVQTTKLDPFSPGDAACNSPDKNKFFLHIHARSNEVESLTVAASGGEGLCEDGEKGVN